MTAVTDEWLAAALDGAPPLTPAQLAILRPVGQRMAQHMNTAPGSTGAASEPAAQQPERNSA
jgi:hypothetical protein